MKELEGRVALVTGGGKGIGRAIARGLAARGVRVVITGRDEKALGEVVGEIANGGGKARHLAGDVRDPAHVEAAVDKAWGAFGALDIVVANAGQSGRIDLGGDLARAEAILQTNLMGAYYTFNAAAPRMKGPGRLLATSSVLAKFGVPGYAAYCASKAGILGLVRAVAHEVGPKKITCNAIVPGWVDTKMSDDGLAEIAASAGTTAEEIKKEAVTRFPLGRFLEPEEIAEYAVFLCTKAADGITGQALSICGGATAFGG
jgi:NAD(P)-dependent dehydrogenase (short-subunit alcohol dehydrogenase family)